MEGSAGFRDYLFCLGFHFSRDSRWSTRSTSIFPRGDEVPDRGPCPLRMAAGEGNAISYEARMGLCDTAGCPHFRSRLWVAFLGRTEGAIWNCGGHDGNDSGVHGDCGHFDSEERAAHRETGARSDRGNRRCGRAGQPLGEFRRYSDRSDWSDGIDYFCDQLVDRIGPDSQASVAYYKGDEFRCADAGWWSLADDYCRYARRVSRISSTGSVGEGVAGIGLSNCGGVNRRFYGIRLAAAPRIADQGGHVCLRESDRRGNRRIFAGRGSAWGAHGSRDATGVSQHPGYYDHAKKKECPRDFSRTSSDFVRNGELGRFRSW